MKRFIKALVIILIIVVVIVAGLFIGSRYMQNQAKQALNSIEKYTITKGDLSLVTIGSGKIVSSDVKTIIPSGTLNEINVNVGDIVKKGDLLAKYTDVRGTKLDLTSDYDGVITAIPNSASATLGKSATSAFEISGRTNLQIDIQITEKEIYKIKTEQTALVYIEALNKEYSGKVSRISYAGNTDKDFTLYTVTVTFEGITDDVYLGMTGSAKIDIETKKGVYKVPTEAIIEDGNKRYILKSEWLNNPTLPQKDFYIEVETGLSDTDYVELISGGQDNLEILIPQNDATKFPAFFRTGSG